MAALALKTTNGSKGLVRYEAACKALAAAVSADEVKDIRNAADAMRAAARIAKNKQLEVDAAEIRIRAERRLGELLQEQKKTVGLHKGGRPKTSANQEEVSSISLPEAGIDHKLSSRAQKLAAVPKQEFEQELTDWRERVSSENKRVTTRLQERGELEIRRVESKDCTIPDSAIVHTESTCPTCGQRWPEGRPIHG
jgi:hypothetical protein